jgi:hypothetical protein
VKEQQHAGVPLRRVRAVGGAGRLLSTLKAGPADGRPRRDALYDSAHQVMDEVREGPAEVELLLDISAEGE